MHFFSEAFHNSQVDISQENEVLEVIPKCVSNAQNATLTKVVTLEEVKSTLFSIGGDKAPSLDGFLVLFFQKLWDVLAQEPWEVVEDSRVEGFVMKIFNNTFIALVPKKEEALSFNDFRPFALCNIVYKIILKVMENRLKVVLYAVISPKKSGFSPNRSIYEGIIVAYEAIHSIRLAKTKKMLVKLDIRKEYDEVNRSFLLKVLRRFGFSEEWIKWVANCINTTRFSILLNGSPQGFFVSEKGIRQGDPISPFLFIIMVEALGRLISKKREDGGWKVVHIAEGVNPLSHLQFADDTLLMGETSFREARLMKNILDKYSKAFGQCIN